jgi:methyl-accepting chemotaxis protein
MNRGGKQQGPMIELERRAYQIKEVVRASTALRADMPPEAICALVAQTIHSALGFRAAVINLIMPGSRHFMIAATAGISDAERQRLINDPPPVDHIISLMRRDFQVSNSFFIGHEHKYMLEGAGGITLLTPSSLTTPRTPNSWHPDDVFFVPLYSMRESRLLGIISLDLPEDGKIPSFETVEVIELLANQAATALDTARLFQERNHERQALEYGLAELLAHLERMRQRDFSARAHLRASALTHVAGALNDVSETLGNVLADVRDAGTVVQQQASEMRNAATQLVDNAQRQAEQIHSASEIIQRTSEEMRQIVTRAAESSAIAEEANSISNEGREAAERAGEGMNAVREITLQAARRIKRLGESSQEIGNVIQLVSDFASQTHLLALNAAIEAANAGEHGSGFAIVAREIRALAQNSNDATKQIHARIKGIQNETNQVAVTVEYATQQVVLLSDLVTRSGSALHAIDIVIQRIISEIATVHQTAEEQARATATVSGSMTNIADITGATWESAENMRASMDRLTEMATILRTKIEMFRLNDSRQTQSVAASPVQPPARTTATPSTSFPAVAFPGASQPPAPGPAASFPARPFADPPGANPHAAADHDMAMMATTPMPIIQTPLTATMPTTAKMPATPHPASIDRVGELDPLQRNNPAVQATETAPFANAPTPPPLFPTSNSPFTPMRLAALEDTPDANTANQTTTDGASTMNSAIGSDDDSPTPPDSDVASALIASPPEAPTPNQENEPATSMADPPTGEATNEATGEATSEPPIDEPVAEVAPEATPDSAQDATIATDGEPDEGIDEVASETPE